MPGTPAAAYTANRKTNQQAMTPSMAAGPILISARCSAPLMPARSVRSLKCTACNPRVTSACINFPMPHLNKRMIIPPGRLVINETIFPAPAPGLHTLHRSGLVQLALIIHLHGGVTQVFSLCNHPEWIIVPSVSFSQAAGTYGATGKACRFPADAERRLPDIDVPTFGRGSISVALPFRRDTAVVASLSRGLEGSIMYGVPIAGANRGDCRS